MCEDAYNSYEKKIPQLTGSTYSTFMCDRINNTVAS